MGHLEERVILDTMDDLGGPQGSYPEGFMSLSLFLAEICKLVVLVKNMRYRQTTYSHQTSDIHCRSLIQIVFLAVENTICPKNLVMSKSPLFPFPLQSCIIVELHQEEGFYPFFQIILNRLKSACIREFPPSVINLYFPPGLDTISLQAFSNTRISEP